MGVPMYQDFIEVLSFWYGINLFEIRLTTTYQNIQVIVDQKIHGNGPWGLKMTYFNGWKHVEVDLRNDEIDSQGALLGTLRNEVVGLIVFDVSHEFLEHEGVVVRIVCNRGVIEINGWKAKKTADLHVTASSDDFSISRKSTEYGNDNDIRDRFTSDFGPTVSYVD